MKQDWRLNTAEGVTVGRATVDETPVLITEDKNREGIEIRSPNIQLEAITRTDSISDFSASGWDIRADQYSATMHLPPGWRVLHAFGVDKIEGTWLSQWDLWDVFLLLIIIAASRRLMGNTIAALAGCTFLIALHEPDFPLLIIPAILLVIALLPIATGKTKSLLRSTGIVFSAALVLSVITFAVHTFRLAIYPSLEHSIIGTYNPKLEGNYFPTPPQPTETQLSATSEAEDARQAPGRRARNLELEEVVVTASKIPNLYQVTENDRVQTGPGLPTWIWNAMRLHASGPLTANQRLFVYYSPPLATSIWQIISVFLTVLYAGAVILRLARLSQFKSAKATDFTNGGVATLLLMGLVTLTGLFSSPRTIAEDYPPEYLLDTLEKRLLKAPDCLPGCASLNNGHIHVSGSDITFKFNAYADANIALPLPRGHDSWAMTSASENGRPLPLRKQQDNSFALLTRGHHTLMLKGHIFTDQATISLPLAIHNLTVSATGWAVEGLVEGRVRNATLTLKAIGKGTTQEADTLKTDPAPAFVYVTRHFVLGKEWNIETTVRRIAPKQDAISVPIKLVPKERPLKNLDIINAEAVVVQLEYGQQQISWQSALEATDQLRLEATDSPDYMEEWSFTPASLWKLKYTGIPPIKASASSHAFAPVFKPWPNEHLIVDVTKPKGVAGDTHSIESTLLEVDTSNKLQHSTLTMDIRSTLGTNYTLTLPEDSEVLEFSVDGQEMNIPSGNEIIVPLRPGSQSVALEFQVLKAIGVVSHSPELILPDGATNVRIRYKLPQDRWLLYLSGPAIGPAILYWGVLCVILLGAIGLASLARVTGLQMPVATTGWLLLGVGLSTVNSYGVLVIAVLFFSLAARKQFVNPDTMARYKFNLLQSVILTWGLLTALCVISAIPLGLLANPEMQVVGNGSSSHIYNYYQDIVGATQQFPTVTVVSLPLLAYRAVMLLWSLWLATRLIHWTVWSWKCFTEKAVWIPKATQVKR